MRNPQFYVSGKTPMMSHEANGTTEKRIVKTICWQINPKYFMELEQDTQVWSSILEI